MLDLDWGWREWFSMSAEWETFATSSPFPERQATLTSSCRWIFGHVSSAILMRWKHDRLSRYFPFVAKHRFLGQLIFEEF